MTQHCDHCGEVLKHSVEDFTTRSFSRGTRLTLLQLDVYRCRCGASPEFPAVALLADGVLDCSESAQTWQFHDGVWVRVVTEGEEEEPVTARQSLFHEGDMRIAVRRIIKGDSTVEAEAKKRKIGIRSVITWLNNPKLRGDLEFTEKSTWRPSKQFTRELKMQLAERGKAGESLDVMAREYTGLTPGMVRNWIEGFDLQDTAPIQVPDVEAQAPPPQPPPPPVETAPAPPPEPEEPPPAPRHPMRDEAVTALRNDMSPLAIILALNLDPEKITVDTIRDWEAEDRANKRIRDDPPALPEPHSMNMGQASRYTEAEKQEAVARVVAGVPRSRVAEELGCTVAAVASWVRFSGVPPKPHSGPQRNPRAPEAVQRVLGGEEKATVARDIGVSPTAVYGWVMEEKGRQAAAPLPPAGKGVQPDEERQALQRRAAERWAAGENYTAVMAEMFPGSSPLLVYEWARRYGIRRAPEHATDRGRPPGDLSISGEELRLRREVVARWAAGESATDLMRKHFPDKDPNKLYRWASDFGVSRRAEREAQRTLPTEDEKLEIVKLWAAGDSARELIKPYPSLHPSALYGWAEKFGIQRPAWMERKHPAHPLRAEAVRRALTGENRQKLAAELGLKSTTIDAWVREEKLVRATQEAAAVLAAAASAAAVPPPVVAPPPPPAPVPPPPVVVAAAVTPPPPPAPVAPGPRRLVAVTQYGCWNCQGPITPPENKPGMLKIKQAECPHCGEIIDF